MPDLVVDIVVAVLLVVTIAYAVSLNRRLSLLRQDREELERLAAEFAGATVRADEGIRKLRLSADELGEVMDSRIRRAEGLKEDLDYLIERGNGIADRLESSVRSQREAAPGGEEAASGAREDSPDATQSNQPVRSDAERELLKALQSVK